MSRTWRRSTSPWLARILRNLHTDQRRSARVRRERRQGDEEPAADTGGSPYERTLTAQRLALLSRALAEIEPHHAEILLLIDVQGLSYAEAAEALDLPIGTIRPRTSRARRALLARIHGADP